MECQTVTCSSPMIPDSWVVCRKLEAPTWMEDRGFLSKFRGRVAVRVCLRVFYLESLTIGYMRTTHTLIYRYIIACMFSTRSRRTRYVHALIHTYTHTYIYICSYE